MTTLYLMGATCLVIAVLLWAVIRGGKREGAAEARAEARDQTIAAVQKAADADRQTLGRMADADAASVSDTADLARERMRKRPPATR